MMVIAGILCYLLGGFVTAHVLTILYTDYIDEGLYVLAFMFWVFIVVVGPVIWLLYHLYHFSKKQAHGHDN